MQQNGLNDLQKNESKIVKILFKVKLNKTFMRLFDFCLVKFFGIVYNMKRTVNILGFKKLMEKLNVWKPKYKKEWLYPQKTNKKQAIIRTLFFETKIAA